MKITMDAGKIFPGQVVKSISDSWGYVTIEFESGMKIRCDIQHNYDTNTDSVKVEVVKFAYAAPEDGVSQRAQVVCNEQGFIACIKFIRTCWNMGLKEAKDWCDTYIDRTIWHEKEKKSWRKS